MIPARAKKEICKTAVSLYAATKMHECSTNQSELPPCLASKERSALALQITFLAIYKINGAK